MDLQHGRGRCRWTRWRRYATRRFRRWSGTRVRDHTLSILYRRLSDRKLPPSLACNRYKTRPTFSTLKEREAVRERGKAVFRERLGLAFDCLGESCDFNLTEALELRSPENM